MALRRTSKGLTPEHLGSRALRLFLPSSRVPVDAASLRGGFEGVEIGLAVGAERLAPVPEELVFDVGGDRRRGRGGRRAGACGGRRRRDLRCWKSLRPAGGLRGASGGDIELAWRLRVLVSLLASRMRSQPVCSCACEPACVRACRSTHARLAAWVCHVRRAVDEGFIEGGESRNRVKPPSTALFAAFPVNSRVFPKTTSKRLLRRRSPPSGFPDGSRGETRGLCFRPKLIYDMI